jgi:hypothetical protein
MILQKYFSHPSLVIIVSNFLTLNTKTWTTNGWDTTNSNPPGVIKLFSQSTATVRLDYAFYYPLHEMLGRHHFAEPKGLVATFLDPILL